MTRFVLMNICIMLFWSFISSLSRESTLINGYMCLLSGMALCLCICWNDLFSKKENINSGEKEDE